MLIIGPDFTRRIDLPGVGPCQRPVDIDRSRSGLAKLVSLRVYAFAQDMVIDGEAEGDEVFVVLMRGRADVDVERAGERVGAFPLRTDGGLRAVYLPPGAAYQLTALTDCDVAYARVRPEGLQLGEARGFAPVDGRLDSAGHAQRMTLTLAAVATGEAFGLQGGSGMAPERFVHVRSDDDGAATLAGERFGDWRSAVLAAGEQATLTVEIGKFDVLIISATQA